MGNVIHAGAGNAEGEWRVVYFLTATWGDAEDYNSWRSSTASTRCGGTLCLKRSKNGWRSIASSWRDWTSSGISKRLFSRRVARERACSRGYEVE